MMQAEQVQFSVYKIKTVAAKRQVINDASGKIEMLQAVSARFEAGTEGLGTVVATLVGDIATWGGDETAPGKVRTIVNNDYTVTHADYLSSIVLVTDGHYQGAAAAVRGCDKGVSPDAFAGRDKDSQDGLLLRQKRMSVPAERRKRALPRATLVH